jgi:hypothetical protein
MAGASRIPGDKKEEAAQTAGDIKGKVQEVASTAAQKAQDVASNVAGKAQNVASTVAAKTDDALSAAGEKMSSWGGSLREKAPQGGMMGSAASAVAGGLEATGDYLQEHGLGDMMSDLGATIRRFPFQAVLVGFGVGYLFARATRR